MVPIQLKSARIAVDANAAGGRKSDVTQVTEARL
jgi:hypothetical protein